MKREGRDEMGEKNNSESGESQDKPKNCCVRCCCTFGRGWQITIWSFIIFFYLLVGGAIFLAVEGPSERERLASAEAERVAATEELEMQLANLTVAIADATNLTLDEAETFTTALVNASQRLALASVTLPATTAPIWEFGPAVFFASTVITTIGYGTIFPETDGGRVLFIFYALIGIPLALIFLSLLGDALTSLLDRMLSPIAKKLGEESIAYRVIAFIVACVIALVAFIFIPAAIFYAIEPWTYGEAVYYTFVTLTTVGFGDFVPAQSTETIESAALRGLYTVANSLWIWFGLAMISLIITEIQKIVTAMGAASRKHLKKGHEKMKGKFKKRDTEKQELPGVTEGDGEGDDNDSGGEDVDNSGL